MIYKSKLKEKCPPGTYHDRKKGGCYDNQNDKKVQCPSDTKPDPDSGCAPIVGNKTVSDKVASTKDDNTEKQHWHGKESKVKIYTSKFKKIKEEKLSKTDEIINELITTGWSKDNESQMKATELLKGLALSDDPKANEFMKELDDYTTSLKGEKKLESSLKEASFANIAVINGISDYMKDSGDLSPEAIGENLGIQIVSGIKKSIANNNKYVLQAIKIELLAAISKYLK